MSRQPRGGEQPQPRYRQWREAAEADATVPHEVMAIIGAYARHLESEGGPIVSVSRRQLRRYTHLSMSALQTAHEYAERHGWLVRQPTPDGGDERPVYYLPEIGHSGERRGLRGRPVPDRSAGQDDAVPWDGAVPLRPTERSDRSVGRSDMLRPTERLTVDRSVPRSPTRSREIDRSISLRPGSPLDLLRQVEEGVDDTVAGAVVAILRERGAQIPAGVLYAEIDDGHGPALIAEARRRISGAPISGTPSAPPIASLCDRCGEPGHVPADCPTLVPPSDPEPSAAPDPAAVGERCQAGERCLRPSSPIDPATGYHALPCGAVAALRTGWAARPVRGVAS